MTPSMSLLLRQKGLIVNSHRICLKPKRNRAKANIRGQNGRFFRTGPVVRTVKCKSAARGGAER